MRVLHIGKYFPPSAGGIENFTGDLLLALESQDVKVAALVHQDPDCYSDETEQDGTIANIQRVRTYGRFFYAPVSPGFPRAFTRFVTDFQPDILHFHLPNTSAFWALLLPTVKKIPWVIHWHSDVVSSKIDRALACAYMAYRPFEQMMLSRADVIICTSRRYLDSSLALQKWRKKCKVVPLGINPGRYSLTLAHDKLLCDTLFPQVDKNTFNILAIGRLTYYKGHEVLVKAVAKTNGVNVFIVGQGERRKKIEHLIRRLGVQDKVALMGYLPDLQLHELMKNVDCLCLPSIERTEAFGLVLLEAMYYAKPVVASDVSGSGIGWVVDDGKTGILFSSGDDGKLATSLQFLADKPNSAKNIGQNGNDKFYRFFHINNIAKQVIKIYNGLLL